MSLKEKEYKKVYRKQFPWKRTLESIKQRCNNIKNDDYYKYGGRGIKCLITEEELKEIWFRDKAYDMKKPSIDRENNNGNYTFRNCRYIEFKENAAKDKRKIIYQYDLTGHLLKKWNSIAEASKFLKIPIGNISNVATGHRMIAGGFIWSYK